MLKNDPSANTMKWNQKFLSTFAGLAAEAGIQDNSSMSAILAAKTLKELHSKLTGKHFITEQEHSDHHPLFVSLRDQGTIRENLANAWYTDMCMKSAALVKDLKKREGVVGQLHTKITTQDNGVKNTYDYYHIDYDTQVDYVLTARMRGQGNTNVKRKFYKGRASGSVIQMAKPVADLIPETKQPTAPVAATKSAIALTPKASNTPAGRKQNGPVEEDWDMVEDGDEEEGEYVRVAKDQVKT